MNVKERDWHLNQYIKEEIIQMFTILNHQGLDKDTFIEIFDSFSKNKAVGMERLSWMLRTQGIIKNEGGALDNLIHKK